MTDTKILDSSILISYLFEGKFREVVEEEKNSISEASLFEIKKKLLLEQIPKNIIQKHLDYLKHKCITKPITQFILGGAAEFAIENKLGVIDAVIYSTSILNDMKLLTRDNDFRGMKGVIIVE